MINKSDENNPEYISSTLFMFIIQLLSGALNKMIMSYYFVQCTS